MSETSQPNPEPLAGRSQVPANLWPSLPVAEWSDTRDTLQLWTQIVGKVRMVNEPLVNHWWNVVLYVTARGLTTGLISHPSGQGFQIDFDFRVPQLEVTTTAGERKAFVLESGPVSEFYVRIMNLLDESGVSTKIWPVPVEIEGAIPFPD